MSQLDAGEETKRTAFVESLLDNLPVWTIVAAAIAFLYLVWATLEILSRPTSTGSGSSASSLPRAGRARSESRGASLASTSAPTRTRGGCR